MILLNKFDGVYQQNRGTTSVGVWLFNKTRKAETMTLVNIDIIF